jgi:hypothetical protein
LLRLRAWQEHLSNIVTIAGDGTRGYADGDDKAAAQFYGLPDGSMVFVADGTRGEDAQSNRVRSIKMN